MFTLVFTYESTLVRRISTIIVHNKSVDACDIGRRSFQENFVKTIFGQTTILCIISIIIYVAGLLYP